MATSIVDIIASFPVAHYANITANAQLSVAYRDFVGSSAVVSAAEPILIIISHYSNE